MKISTHRAVIHINREIHLNYLLYRPDTDPNEKLPLLLYLHGSGQCGDDLDLVKMHWPPAYFTPIPMLVLAPQCPSDLPLWETHAVKSLLDSILADLPVDPSRIYITGMSMGAYGMWNC